MTETEGSGEVSRSTTLNLDALLNKEQLTAVTPRDGCFIIAEPLDPPHQTPAAVSNSEVTSSSTSHREGMEVSEAISGGMLPKITRISNKFPAQDSFLLMQKWEGVVTRIADDSFFATLTDLTAAGEDEEAEIPIDEISPADMSLLHEGAVFYWCIGYRDTLMGQRIRASEIRFRRLPTWSKRELDTARKEAEELVELLNWK